ncbi:MAG: KamA family radical SAM protein, partial [Candidatus Izemoplasmatales bacterium]
YKIFRMGVVMKAISNKKLIRNIEDTFDYDCYSEEEKKTLTKIVDRHPIQIPYYYYHLIDWNDSFDAIKRQCIPSLDEISEVGDYDTSDESSNTKLLGLQHKYKQTVLVLSTNICFMYCRHCFRKRMVGYSNNEIAKRKERTVTYVKNHPNVNNVLITGGDSFTMSNEMIESYLEELTKINHLDFIRFGTRSIVVFPERIYKDKKLLSVLEKYNQKVKIIIVTHFNHVNEITAESALAVNALCNIGLTVRNQAVLLKGVNDNKESLANLLNGLVAIGVHPYYVFQCRPVKGATHFQVTLSEGIDIVDEARKLLNGISKAFRYIISHKKGKIEIVGKTDDKIMFKFHQSKFEEDANKIFFAPLEENAKWLNDNLELF